jgi:putative transposase
MKTVCEVLGVSRSNLAVKSKRPTEWVDRRKTPALDDGPLVTELRGLVADVPTYGYRRVWALLRRSRGAQAQPRVNAKRVYRVMRTNGLLIERRPRHAQSVRRHDGKIAVDRSNARWCSDGFEFRCDDGAPLRVVFALDCCDREAMSWVASTGGYTGDMVRDVMPATETPPLFRLWRRSCAGSAGQSPGRANYRCVNAETPPVLGWGFWCCWGA